MFSKKITVFSKYTWQPWFIVAGVLTLILMTLSWLPAAGNNTELPGVTCAQAYRVKFGDTLYSIARRYDVPLQQLIDINRIGNPNRIYAGSGLCIKLEQAEQTHQNYHPSPVVLWNEVMLSAVRHGPPRPTVITRNLYIVHQAIYDAWAMYDRQAMPLYLSAEYKRPVEEHTEANKAAAVSQAAYQTLMVLFPTYEANSQAFSSLLEMQGYTAVNALEDVASAPSIGYMAAAAVLAGRENDGSNAANNYADMTTENYPELYQPLNSADPTASNALSGPDYDPNHWQPLRVPTGLVTDEYGQPMADQAIPESFNDQVFLTPHWGDVMPFALLSGDQFRPSAPPQYGSADPYVDGLGREMTNDEAFRLQVGEIAGISAGLTDRQKVIAEYWADGPRSETPPGHWNALAHGISERDHLGIDEDVKLYFALNAAVLDAGIAAWDAKRAYDYVRPISAIRHLYAGEMIEAWAGPDRGTALIPAENWRPYQQATFVTPPFGEYVSGHSTFSAAAAEVLTRFSGSNIFYDGETVLYYEDFNQDGIPDMLGQHIVPVGGNMFEGSPAKVIVLQWPTFQDASAEAGVSRRFGGIHFQDSDLRGREMGKEIGAQAYEMAKRFWSLSGGK
jgi:LysM repeat protein